MQKKFLLTGFLLFFVLSFFCSPMPVSLAKSFSDVPEDFSHYQAIEYLKSANIVQGYSDGTFQPDKSVNRAEALKMALGQAKVALYKGTDSAPFSDVATNAWFYPYIMQAYQDGIVAGYENNVFKPEQSVNLAESLKMIFLINNVTLPTVKEPDTVFADVSTTDWYGLYAMYARDRNIVLSQDDGKLHAERAMTRGEFAELLYRLDMVKKNNAAFDLSSEWNFMSFDALDFKMKLPSGWDVVKEKSMTVIWKKDPVNPQPDLHYVTPLSAKIEFRDLTLPEELTTDQYFSQIKNMMLSLYDEKIVEFHEKKMHDLIVLGVSIVPEHVEDWYFIFPNGHVLAVYSKIGDGARLFDFQKIVFAMVGSLEYVPNGDTTADEIKAALMEKINTAVLVESGGKVVIDQISDAKIIETDAIGTGLGPVDYYYSEILDITIKYERTDDTILDKRPGKTTTF